MMRLTLMTVVLLLGTPLQAQAPLRKLHFNLYKGIGIKGYDPVAYFVTGKAQEGKATFSAVTEGVTYLFTSTVNRDAFLKNPGKYEPMYGGWCAYAMGATGEKVEVDPETFKIINGKLYLFYNAYFNNTLTKWNADEGSLKIKADRNWASIFK